MNNIFAGGGTAVGGSAQQSSNLITTAPGLVDIDGFDYRLTANSPAAAAAPRAAGDTITPRHE
jgi:hypothetical protein